MAVKFGARSTYVSCAKLQQGQRQLPILGRFYFHTGEPAAEAHLSIFYCPNSTQRYFLSSVWIRRFLFVKIPWMHMETTSLIW